MFTYLLIEEKIDSDIGNYISYGIEIFDAKVRIGKITDLSLNKIEVSMFCENLNALQISPKDISIYIEDFLSEI